MKASAHCFHEAPKSDDLMRGATGQWDGRPGHHAHESRGPEDQGPPDHGTRGPRNRLRDHRGSGDEAQRNQSHTFAKKGPFANPGIRKLELYLSVD